MNRAGCLLFNIFSVRVIIFNHTTHVYFIKFIKILFLMSATSSSATQSTHRGYNNIFLIGSVQNQIVGKKLPSNRPVINVLFYNLRHVRLNIRESAKLILK